MNYMMLCKFKQLRGLNEFQLKKEKPVKVEIHSPVCTLYTFAEPSAEAVTNLVPLRKLIYLI